MDTPAKRTPDKIQAWIAKMFQEHKSLSIKPTHIYTDEAKTNVLQVNSHVEDGTNLFVRPIAF